MAQGAIRNVSLVLWAALAISACSPQTVPTKKHADGGASVEEQAPAPKEETDVNGVALNLADCAGATAFLAGISPIKQTQPKTDTPDESFYWTLLALLDKEPGFEGAAGRLAAETAATAWMDKPEAAIRTFVGACKTRYAPQ